jgi:hypothetical protein
MHRLNMRRWHRWALLLTAATLLLSGLVWMGLHHGLGGGPNAAAGDVPHAAEAAWMRLHGAAGFAALFVLGVLAAGHLPQGWRLTGRQRWAGQRYTGLLLCSVAVALVLTGYALYYFAPENLRPTLGWLHTGLGVLMAALGAFHAKQH